MRYANVAFPLSVNQVFTYSVPAQLDAVLQPGVRVLAPFRRTKQEGVVVERVDETDLAPKVIKNVAACLDETPMFSPEMLSLMDGGLLRLLVGFIALLCRARCRANPEKRAGTTPT